MTATTPARRSGRRSEERELWLQRAALALALLAAWEAWGRLVSDRWTSRPSAMLVRLAEWASNDLARHIGVTFAEIGAGLAIGVPLGVVVGLVVGRSPRAGAVFRPFIVLLNSLPIVAMTPLLIMWFGLGMQPKIVLVAFVSFLLLFFNTFSGARAVDNDLLDSLTLMGATRWERFRKVVLPGSTSWIMAALKNALPYAFIAAVIGEMMLSQAGLGHLITRSAQQFDMTGVYTVLLLMMVLGALVNDLLARLERWLMRWRVPADNR